MQLCGGGADAVMDVKARTLDLVAIGVSASEDSSGDIRPIGLLAPSEPFRTVIRVPVPFDEAPLSRRIGVFFATQYGHPILREMVQRFDSPGSYSLADDTVTLLPESACRII